MGSLADTLSACRINDPELEFILLAARTSTDEAAGSHLRDVAQSDLDWNRVVDLAGRHRVRPILDRTLRAAGVGGVPSPIQLELRRQSERLAVRNSLLTFKLIEILELFERRGVEAVPIKGPLLAATAYGDIAAREFTDLDIVIRRRDVALATELLQSQGYALQHSSPRAADMLRIATEFHYSFVHQKDRFLVELHCELAPWYFGFPLDIDDVWPRLDKILLSGTTVRSLSAEDLLLYLCGHGTKHLWGRLAWICDIAALLRHSPESVLTAAAGTADALGVRRMFNLGLHLPAELIGSRLPVALARSIQDDDNVLALAGETGERIRGRPEELPWALAQARFHIRAKEKLADRARYCLFLVFAPNRDDIDRFLLPRFLFPLYWVTRPIRLAVEHAPEAVRLLLRRIFPRRPSSERSG